MDELTVRTLVAGWRSAEQSLYSLGGGDVERYQRAIRLVRALVDRLADVETTDELVDRWSEAERLAAEVADEAGLPPGAIVADQVAGAAFSLRHQTVVALEARRARVDRIAEARAEGGAWVDIHRSRADAVEYGAPVVEVRMHLPSGLAVQRVDQPALGSGLECSWALEVLALEPETGDHAIADPPAALLAMVGDYADEESARDAEAALVRAIEAYGPERVG